MIVLLQYRMQNSQFLPPLLFALYMIGFAYGLGVVLSWWEAGLLGLTLLGLYCVSGRYVRRVFGAMVSMVAVWGLFFRYFHRELYPADLYLFWTHISETFESLGALHALFLPTLLGILVGILLWWKIPKVVRCRNKGWWGITAVSLPLALWSLPPLSPLKALVHLPFIRTTTLSNTSALQRPLYPKRATDYHLFILIGESMRYDSYIEAKLKGLGKAVFSKKIYAGATNTDVSVPLFINGAYTTKRLSKKSSKNLFVLAKKNGYQTAFISIQTDKALHYIRPYLQPEAIDYYRTFSKAQRHPQYDILLLQQLQQRDFSTKQFIVMQQIGEHAPYRYYKNAPRSGSITAHYYRAVDESFRLYRLLIGSLRQKGDPFIFIYLSDHGECIGEEGRYGHNAFVPKVYEVPFFITANIPLPKGYKSIRSHYELSAYVRYLLGYGDAISIDKRPVRVNGTMLSGEDGFLEILR